MISLASIFLVLPSPGGCTLKFFPLVNLVGILSVLMIPLQILGAADLQLVIKLFLDTFPKDLSNFPIFFTEKEREYLCESMAAELIDRKKESI